MLEHGHEAVLTSARAVDLLDQIRIQKEGYKNNVRMLSKFVKRKS
jgi:hypothetical protein